MCQHRHAAQRTIPSLLPALSRAFAITGTWRHALNLCSCTDGAQRHAARPCGCPERGNATHFAWVRLGESFNPPCHFIAMRSVPLLAAFVRNADKCRASARAPVVQGTRFQVANGSLFPHVKLGSALQAAHGRRVCATVLTQLHRYVLRFVRWPWPCVAMQWNTLLGN
jgi:hypothetical protein